jgi:hypothetical protein
MGSAHLGMPISLTFHLVFNKKRPTLHNNSKANRNGRNHLQLCFSLCLAHLSVQGEELTTHQKRISVPNVHARRSAVQHSMF